MDAPAIKKPQELLKKLLWLYLLEELTG